MDLIAGLSPQAWTASAVGVIAFIGGVTAAIINAFGGVQKQVQAAQSQLTNDLERQGDALRAELADVRRRHEAELADCCARCERCEKALAALGSQVDAVKRGKR